MMHRLTGVAAVGCVLATLLAPSAADAAKAPKGGVYTLPAGQTFTISNASFSACDALVYGYRIKGAKAVQLGDNDGGGCSVTPIPDTTVGPFDSDVTFRLYLTDFAGPVYTFYSNNRFHAAQTGADPYQLGICDSGFGGTGPKQSCDPDPESSNLTLTLTIGTPSD